MTGFCRLRRGSAVLAAGAILVLSAAAMADTTAPAGFSQPQGTIQPTVAINYLVQLQGADDNLGDIKMFAGNFAPAGFAFANGQLLSVVQNQDLFAAIGNTYGGDGNTTFALPDLRGRAPIGAGQGPGLSNYTLGQTVGTETVTLTNANLAPHNHTLPGGGVTGNTGGGQPYNNLQPSLALNYTIALEGIFPTNNGGTNPVTGSEPLMGSIEITASSVLANGEAFARGQILPLADVTALFQVIGGEFGGDIFANPGTLGLPDLRGRAPIGVGQAPGGTPVAKAQSSGQESVTMTQSTLVPHGHGLPPSADVTGVTGGGAAQTNMQPTLGLHYMIALGGIFPPPDDGTPLGDDGPFTGEIRLWAGDFAPTGWAFAEGQILNIAQNTALFSILGTTYGGNGQTTYALPDLRGMLAVGAGQGLGLSPWSLGEVTGNEQNFLTDIELPTHVHDLAGDVVVDAPEPMALSIFGLGLLGLGFARSRRRA